MNTRAWIVFLNESGVSLLPQIRRTYAPRGRTPLLRHRLNWKRASMAGALGYHSTDPDRGARLCFHLKPGSYDTAALIEVLEQMKVFYRGERVVLVWDGLSAHWSRAMRLGRRPGLAHPGAITRLRSRAQPGGAAVVLTQET
ncbi:transposase [Streptomyces sp. NBC_01351]|uniref:transposase n=1 Tax=Streptomyces sp. NBC_01351 TaxID=2903833 RepID=UPI002E35F3CC|nr:transposase [Streptomyces sp. NBC_01351]